MRSRSGAFHADSQQTFLDLAIASENTTGLFYDNKVNYKIMKKLNQNKTQTSQLQHFCLKGPSFQRLEEKDLFSGFDFSIEIQVDKQEREELERMRSSHLRQINVGVITSNSQQVLHNLSTLLGVPAQEEQISRGVNLVIATKGQTIYKYWIFQRQFLKRKDELIPLYLNHCSQLYDIGQTDNDPSVLQSGKCSQSWIKERISTIFT